VCEVTDKVKCDCEDERLLEDVKLDNGYKIPEQDDVE